MTTISKFRDEGRTTILAQVLVTTKYAGGFEFEILEVDAPKLRDQIGIKLFLTCDGEKPFWGELVLLEPCQSTAPGLNLMRNRPTLKGIFKVYSDEPVRMQ